MKSAKITIALTLLLTALDSQASRQMSGNYKLAVIQGKAASRQVLSGDYNQAISTVNYQQSKKRGDRFENAMALCAAKIKINDIVKAIVACDKAVKMIDVADAYHNKKKYKALALSNRAIAKQLNDDNRGAYQDFNDALDLNRAQFIVDNYFHFSSVVASQQYGMTQR